MTPFNSSKSKRRKNRTNRHRRHLRTLRLEGLEHRQMLAAVHGSDFAPDAEQEPAYAEQAEMAGPLEWLSQESFTFSEDTVESVESAIDAYLDEQGVELEPESIHESGTYETGFFGIDLDWNIDATIQFSDLEIDEVELAMVSGSGDIPYYLELTVSLEDITFDADVDVGIYAQTGDGVTIDTEAEGTLEDVQFTMTLAPPREGVNEFSLDSAIANATLDASYASDVDITLTAQTKAALVTALSLTPALVGLGPVAPLIALGIVDSVTTQLENRLESELTGEIDSQLDLNVEDQLTSYAGEQIDEAIGLLDFTFWTLAGVQTDCVDIPYDTEAVEIYRVSYQEGTGATYWVGPASEDSGIQTPVIAGPQYLNQSSQTASPREVPQYAVGLRGTDPRDLQAMDRATEPFFRPNPAGDGTTEQFYRPSPLAARRGSSLPGASFRHDMEGQGTNSDAWDTANDPRRVLGALAEDSWKVEELAGLHGWKVEELTEDSWKVEEVSREVVDTLAEDSLRLLSGVNGMLFDVNR